MIYGCSTAKRIQLWHPIQVTATAVFFVQSDGLEFFSSSLVHIEDYFDK
jgi:hypothetical protein